MIYYICKVETVMMKVRYMMERMWVAELIDDDFEVLVNATNEEEAEREANEILGDRWLYVHEVEI